MYEKWQGFVVDTMEGNFVGFDDRLPEDATDHERFERALRILPGIERMVGKLDPLSRRTLVGPIADILPEHLTPESVSQEERDRLLNHD